MIAKNSLRFYELIKKGMMMKLSEKIKQLRNEAGLTQPELAHKADIEQSYLSKLENDKGSPSFEVISKIASALGFDAMSLIESLDQQYIQDNLSHLPEIAAKAAEMRVKKSQQMKKRYVQATLLILMGIVCLLFGQSKVIFSENLYEYYSEGIIAKKEPLQQFQTHPIKLIDENWEAAKKRITANITRLDQKYLSVDNYLGENFIQPLGESRRNFRLIERSEHVATGNQLFIVFGFVVFVAGCFYMFYIYHFKD